MERGDRLDAYSLPSWLNDADSTCYCKRLDGIDFGDFDIGWGGDMNLYLVGEQPSKTSRKPAKDNAKLYAEALEDMKNAMERLYKFSKRPSVADAAIKSAMRDARPHQK